MTSRLLRSLFRTASLPLLATFIFSTCAASALAQQDGPGSFVGTWSVVGPDGSGGQNYTWITFTPDGRYQAVTASQGGSQNGNVIQRWGHYQSRTVGQDACQVSVQVTGGAPSQLCMQGMGCKPIQGIQGQFQAQFQVVGNQLRMANGSSPMQRAEIPQQLRAELPAQKMLASPPPTPSDGGNGGGRYNPDGSKINIPGLGNNCDNAQQNRVCTVNGGHIYVDNRGCQVCAGP